MNCSTRLTYSLSFDIQRDDTWPESAKWPEYKNNTDKSYRPERARATVSWAYGEKIKPPTITVYGPRYIKSGPNGAEARSTYYYYSNAETPDWVKKISDECVYIANQLDTP